MAKLGNDIQWRVVKRVPGTNETVLWQEREYALKSDGKLVSCDKVRFAASRFKEEYTHNYGWKLVRRVGEADSLVVKAKLTTGGYALV